MKRVFLIDTMSHIFRAFFAPMGARQEPLRNSKGQVTQAVFVFTNMLRKLLSDENPDYIAAVFDSAANQPSVTNPTPNTRRTAPICRTIFRRRCRIS